MGTLQSHLPIAWYDPSGRTRQDECGRVVDDGLAEKGKQVIGDHLEVGDGQRDADDGDGLHAAAVVMTNGGHRPRRFHDVHEARVRPRPASMTRLPKGHSIAPAMRKQATPAGIVTTDAGDDTREEGGRGRAAGLRRRNQMMLKAGYACVSFHDL